MATFRLRSVSDEVVLPVGDFVVGRSAECDLQVQGVAISRQHAIFRSDGHRVTVEDMGSRNGVLVNGRPALSETELTNDDRISLGAVEFRFSVEGPTLAAGPISLPPDALRIARPFSIPPAAAEHALMPSVGGGDTGSASSLHASLLQAAERDLMGGNVEAVAALCEKLLESERGMAARGRKLDEPAFRRLGVLFVELARRTSEPAWLVRFVEHHELASEVPDLDAAERLLAVPTAVRQGAAKESLTHLLQRIEATEDASSRRTQGVISRMRSALA